MSGTSVNGVDVVLARFDPQPIVLASHEHPIAAELRQRLLELNRPGADELNRVARLDNAVARLFAAAVNTLLKQARVGAAAVRALGSHGQTVRHAPPVGGDPDAAFTVQIGNPSLLAELTGITTVADFRRRDMAAGGQGAPLAPAFHAACFTDQNVPQAVVNIGGIANLTLLPGPGRPVIGFDTGPGNALLDGWAERCLGQPYDQDGAWGRNGRVQPTLLERWLSESFFALPAPKSTGRELFHLDWLGDLRNFAPADVQATLLALTAESIAAAVRVQTPAPEQLWVCGGGAHNTALMQALSERLAPLPVRSTAAVGIDPDFLEALGFAWLARQTLAGLPGNLPAVTGARGPRVLGGVYPA